MSWLPGGLRPLGLGKVRDLYEVNDDHLLLVASDQQVREQLQP